VLADGYTEGDGSSVQDLDLVEVNPVADPPVCQILDFGKYRSEAKSTAADAKRKDEREPEDDDD
jgi:translation initiation factor IF-3